MTIGTGFMSYGYPMMANNFAMMQMSNQNTMQYLTCKYGCSDCFRTTPYLQEYPKPFNPKPKQAMQPSAISRFWHKMVG